MIHEERWCRHLRRMAASEETVSGILKAWDPSKSGGYDLLLEAEGQDLLIRWDPQDAQQEKLVLGSKGKVLTFSGAVVGETEAYKAIQNAVLEMDSPPIEQDGSDVV